MNNFPIRFEFKGDRDYVHGTDIYGLLEAAFETLSARILELNFHGFSRCQMVCMFVEPAVGGKVSGIGIDEAGKRFPFWLVETEERVTERYAFDENALASGAAVEGKSIHSDFKQDFSLIEHVVALTKRLNYILMPDVHGKWVFGQLRLQRPLPSVVRDIVIIQKSMLAGRFSVQEIILDGESVGRIHFITSES